MARTTWGHQALWRALSIPFQILRRMVLVGMTALLLGIGGGMGGLGAGIKKVSKPERENPVVCVEASMRRSDG